MIPALLARHWRAVILGLMAVLLVAAVATSIVIDQQVRLVVARAQSQVDGEPVSALMKVAGSETLPLAERNRAIWALGQLGATEALPLLESLVTGEECDHSTVVCQRELTKAVRLCSGSFNAGAVVWRHGRLAMQ